jgi:hypothetical protein
MPLVLCVAGLYCLVFAVVTVSWPANAFELTGMHASGHHFLVQVIGLFYLVFGISYFWRPEIPSGTGASSLSAH